MNVIVVGKGGREHALARGLSRSSSVQKTFALPGNHGMQPNIHCFLDDTISSETIAQRCKEHDIELVVIGPEDPLVQGLADQLRTEGLLVFGPGEAGASLEGSKIRSKEFMRDHGIPTAPFAIVSSVADLVAQMENFTLPYVLKADGLAAGKGVFICATADELFQAGKKIFEEKTLGEAGNVAILEQFQPGFELSFFIMTNGNRYVALPMAQDHKRLGDGGEGPNTGGMGTVAPMEIAGNLYTRILDEVVETTVAGLRSENWDYRGVLFIGIMVTEAGPQVLEYNVRFGDPETQVLIPLLDGDWGAAFAAISRGEVPELNWKTTASACVVAAAENYPESPVKGVPIDGDLNGGESQYFLHAGTLLKNDKWTTNGGRVLNSVGLGESIPEAIERAYQQLEKVSWPGMQHRKDIGRKSQVL